jgi:hypothetical protein
MSRARRKIGDIVEPKLREPGADGRQLAEETWPKNAPLWGEALLSDADAAFDESELMPMLEPLPDDEDAGVCSRAAVLSTRKPVPVSPVISAVRGGGIAVKGARLILVETRGES